LENRFGIFGNVLEDSVILENRSSIFGSALEDSVIVLGGKVE